MELNILHLYPTLMGLYGEYANLSVLKRVLEQMGVNVRVTEAQPEDTPDFATADLIYMGAGTERSQKAALTALLPYRKALAEAAESAHQMLFFTGNAMEALGTSVTDADGKCWEGLGLAEFTTVEARERTPVDVIALPTLWEEPVVGFMNKCSVTHGVTSPLFSSLALGFGNDRERGEEGYVSGNLLATHLTGPVLVKNPAFLEQMVQRLFACKGWECPQNILTLPYQRESYEVTLRELRARSK